MPTNAAVRVTVHQTRQPAVGVGLAVVALVPIFVLAGRAFLQDWLPVGDVATIALRVSQVGTRHTPLVGPYSHFGWSHPGPLLYEILAPAYRLAGLRSNGLLLGALLINGGAIVIIVARLYRMFGPVVALAGIACFGTVSWSLGMAWSWYPWNPNIAVLPFAALLVVAATTARNSWWDLPLLAAIGSFVAQTHVAYLPLVVALVPVALIGRSRRVAPPYANRRRTCETPSRGTIGLLTGVVVAVAWVPTLLDALLHDGGNLRKLLDFWLSGHDTMGMSAAIRIMSLELSVRAPWLGFHEPRFIGAVAPRGTPIPVALLAVVLAGVVAWRAKDRLAVHCCLVVLAATVVATFSIARIVGLAYPYLLFATRVIGAASWLAVVVVVVRILERQRRTLPRRAMWVLAIVAMLLVTTVMASGALHAGIGPAEGQRGSTHLARVVDGAVRSLSPGETVRVHASPTFAGETFKAGLMAGLVEKGHAVSTDTSERLHFGSAIANGARGSVELYLTAGAHDYDMHAASYRLVAESGRPVSFPAAAPPPRPGEDPHVYLRRVEPQVDRRTYRRLVEYMVSPSPIAVFAMPRDTRQAGEAS